MGKKIGQLSKVFYMARMCIEADEHRYGLYGRML